MENSFFSFAKHEQGYNHIKQVPPKVCEDFAGYENNENYRLCVISDGHGSDNYPRTQFGSRFAVEATKEVIDEFVGVVQKECIEEELLQDEESGFPMMKQLARSILARWHAKVEDHYSKTPFSPEELVNVSEKYKNYYFTETPGERKIEKAYGATLIFFLVTDAYSLGMQIGDGKCVLISRNGDFSEPIPWDIHCQMNVTTSICDSDACEEFRFYVSEQKPAAVFCGSDGVDDSYTSKEELYALYRTIIDIFIKNGREVGEKEIEEYLPILTRKGSGDDVSIGTVMDMEWLKKLEQLFELQKSLGELQKESATAKRSMDVAKAKRDTLFNDIFRYKRALERPDGTVNVSIIPPNDEIMKDINALTRDIDLFHQKTRELEQRLHELEACITDIQYDLVASTFDKDSNSEEEQLVPENDSAPITVVKIDETSSDDEIGIIVSDMVDADKTEN